MTTLADRLLPDQLWQRIHPKDVVDFLQRPAHPGVQRWLENGSRPGASGWVG